MKKFGYVEIEKYPKIRVFYLAINPKIYYEY